MKAFFALIALLSFASSASAGITGWLTAETRGWQFIRQTGGMRVGVPIEKDGKKLLPVEYDVSGLTAITCKPTTINSGLAVRRIEAVGKEGKIVLRVVTQVVEKRALPVRGIFLICPAFRADRMTSFTRLRVIPKSIWGG